MKKMNFFALALILLLCLCAGSVRLEAQSLSGRYYLYSMQIEDFLIDAGMMTELDLDMNGETWYLEFLGGSRCIAHFGDDVKETTYRVDGRTIYFTENNGSVETGEIAGNRIVLGNDSVIMTFQIR